ncbi:MAG: magnesium transporter, partial [Pedobacter sp.]|nr:magnesium transporter [Pedobacter sp.]
MEELIFEDVKALLSKDNEKALKKYLDQLNISDVEELIDEFPKHAAKFIKTLSLNRAVNAFRILDFPTQERIIKKLSANRLNSIIKNMPPDDRTALFGKFQGDVLTKMVAVLSPEDRKESLALLGYEEDSVGRLMTPDYVSVRAYWTISRVLAYIRRVGKNSETIDVIYILDKNGVLIDDIKIRSVLLADPESIVGELTDNRFISLKATDHQEEAISIFRMNNRVALPVVDGENIMLGIVTVDDILWVANEEYTEDMQKFGGTEALDEPYLDIPLLRLVKKRASWLVVLFLGEMLTATAMQYFEVELQKAVVLSLFIPLIMSSGGNSGSQASTLIIQA